MKIKNLIIAITAITISLLTLTGCQQQQTQPPMIGSKARSGESLVNLKRLHQVLAMYLNDNKETFPDMKDAVKVQQMLAKYESNSSMLCIPGTKQPYQPNAALSNMNVNDISNQAETAVFYEPNVDNNGKRNVLFADGHAEYIDETRWKKVKQASGIK